MLSWLEHGAISRSYFDAAPSCNHNVVFDDGRLCERRLPLDVIVSVIVVHGVRCLKAEIDDDDHGYQKE